MYTNKATYIK